MDDVGTIEGTGSESGPSITNDEIPTPVGLLAEKQRANGKTQRRRI